MASPRELAKHGQGVIPRRVRVGVRPCGVRALNSRMRVREQVRAGAWRMCAWVPSSEAGPARGGTQPSSEADPARGGVKASSEADPARGSVYPSSEANLTRGASAALHWRAAGPPGSWLCCVCVLGVQVDLCFAFFAGFKRVCPGYLGDPYGCPRQDDPTPWSR
jgi:hypothetical protein